MVDLKNFKLGNAYKYFGSEKRKLLKSERNKE